MTSFLPFLLFLIVVGMATTNVNGFRVCYDTCRFTLTNCLLGCPVLDYNCKFTTCVNPFISCVTLCK